MFWNKKKPKSKPQIKTTVPKKFKAKEPPKWQPTFGETKNKDEKPPEVTTKSEPKIDWEDKFLKSLHVIILTPFYIIIYFFIHFLQDFTKKLYHDTGYLSSYFFITRGVFFNSIIDINCI